jgi:hypothetical protein
MGSLDHIIHLHRRKYSHDCLDKIVQVLKITFLNVNSSLYRKLQKETSNRVVVFIVYM